MVYLESMAGANTCSVALSYSIRALFQMLWFSATVQMLVTLKQIFSGNLKIVTQQLLYEKPEIYFFHWKLKELGH